MWYFTWILGLGFACSAGIINAMWLEYQMTTPGLCSEGRGSDGEGGDEH